MIRRMVESVVIVLVLLALFGCGHNTLTYTSGESASVGVTMNSQGYPVFGYDKFNGEALVYAMKDNTLVNVSMTDTGNVNTTAAGIKDNPNKIKGLLIYTGSQTTGYDVDLAEAIAKYDVEAAKKTATKKNIPVVDASIKDGKLEVNKIDLPTTQE